MHNILIVNSIITIFPAINITIHKSFKMTSHCNAVITLRTQNDESTSKGLEILTWILSENGRKMVRCFDNPYNLITALNPENPEYISEFVYIYTGKITSYNIDNWTKTLCGVFNKSIRCPTFYFYRYGLPGSGVSSGCNCNIDVLCPDMNNQLTVSLKAWDII